MSVKGKIIGVILLVSLIATTTAMAQTITIDYIIAAPNIIKIPRGSEKKVFVEVNAEPDSVVKVVGELKGNGVDIKSVNFGFFIDGGIPFVKWNETEEGWWMFAMIRPFYDTVSRKLVSTWDPNNPHLKLLPVGQYSFTIHVYKKNLLGLWVEVSNLTIPLIIEPVELTVDVPSVVKKGEDIVVKIKENRVGVEKYDKICVVLDLGTKLRKYLSVPLDENGEAVVKIPTSDIDPGTYKLYIRDTMGTIKGDIEDWYDIPPTDAYAKNFSADDDILVVKEITIVENVTPVATPTPIPTITPIPTVPVFERVELKSSVVEVAPGSTFDVDLVLNPGIEAVKAMLVNVSYGVEPEFTIMSCLGCNESCGCYNGTCICTEVWPPILDSSGVSIVDYETYDVFNFMNTITTGKGYFKFLGIDTQGVSNIIPKVVATIKFKVSDTVKPGSIIALIPTTATINGENTTCNPIFIKIVKEPWQRYDRNGDGRIDDLELINAIQDWLNNKLSDLDLIQIIMIWLKS